jgi:hypothetical protein
MGTRSKELYAHVIATTPGPSWTGRRSRSSRPRGRPCSSTPARATWRACWSAGTPFHTRAGRGVRSGSQQFPRRHLLPSASIPAHVARQRSGILTTKPAVSSGFSRALRRTRTGDAFLTMAVRLIVSMRAGAQKCLHRGDFRRAASGRRNPQVPAASGTAWVPWLRGLTLRAGAPRTRRAAPARRQLGRHSGLF